jgi:ATP-dependent DNA helicase RecG
VRITSEQIDIWRGMTHETQNLEFKEANNQYDTRRLCRYCVAIANEGGGYLVLGIADKPPRPVVSSQAFPDTQDIAEKLFQWLGFRVDVEDVAHPDGRVVVFSIPARPRGTAYHYEGAYLMRSGEELVPMSEDQLRKIFAEGQPNWLENPALKDQSA